MDYLPDLVAAHCRRAWESETAYERLAAEAGVGAEHASHLLRFAVQRIAEGTSSIVDPYALASEWIGTERTRAQH
ncbi:hypothetical protein [Kibdelosporangium phytohabitans]|uniref:Uncharacterized protein n=1 Tax=Kibdelosporangium phytohabitans TaxID=860235 RepID=A0A0N9ICR0_9PSEU|nr:hypothetical protein [Kibdelosporangium phytohabitans]ALG14137.1 hypothetical protein AOZ06_51225 [Kibdelosporangium phytohabitans]MBE1466877.1 hypothetical protein [Kibdelosporangium phytohabitans]